MPSERAFMNRCGTSPWRDALGADSDLVSTGASATVCGSWNGCGGALLVLFQETIRPGANATVYTRCAQSTVETLVDRRVLAAHLPTGNVASSAPSLSASARESDPATAPNDLWGNSPRVHSPAGRRHPHRPGRPAYRVANCLDVQLQPPGDFLLWHLLHQMQVPNLGPLRHSDHLRVLLALSTRRPCLAVSIIARESRFLSCSGGPFSSGHGVRFHVATTSAGGGAAGDHGAVAGAPGPPGSKHGGDDGRSFLGFEPNHIAAVGTDLNVIGYERESADRFVRTALERIQSMLGVEAAALASRAPLDLSFSPQNILVPGLHGPADRGTPWTRPMCRDYFDRLDVPLLQGGPSPRPTRRNHRASPSSGEATARRYSPDGTAGSAWPSGETADVTIASVPDRASVATASGAVAGSASLVTHYPVALMLGAIGLYGVIAYLVAGRTREFAIRAALGARSGTLLRLVLATGARVVAVGIGAGAGLALLATRVVAQAANGIAPADPLVWASVLLLLVAVCMAAFAGPARRMFRLDLPRALRVD